MFLFFVVCFLFPSMSPLFFCLEILPGQTFITFYICLGFSAFLERDSWWKVRWCFAYALNWHVSWQFWTWLVYRGQRLLYHVYTQYGSYLTHTVPGSLASMGYTPHASYSHLGPVQSVWHLQEELALITGPCGEAVGLGNPRDTYGGATLR